MAIRLTSGGYQSYDPAKAKKKVNTIKGNDKKTCPAGEKLVNGVCVPIEKKPEPKRPVPVSDLSRGVVTGYKTEEAQHEAEIAKLIAEGGRKARTREELIAEGAIEPTEEELIKMSKPLEEAGAFEKVTPKEVELSPPELTGESIPVIGPGTAAIQGVLSNAIKKGWLPIFETEFETGEQVFPLTDETMREGALREIKIKSYDEGISLGESFGAMVEAIPVVGGLLGKYIGGLVEAPYANQKMILSEMKKIKEAASTGQEKVRNGLESPDYGLDRARSMEEDVARLEGRIKYLIVTSAILKANADEINKIQEEILVVREKIVRYKQASIYGVTAELTGTGRIIPTDEQMFFELKRLNEGD